MASKSLVVNPTDSSVAFFSAIFFIKRYVNNIKTQLLKYRRLSEKQVEAAIRQIKKENKFNLDNEQTSSSRTSKDLVIDIRNKFIDILQRKIDKN